MKKIIKTIVVAIFAVALFPIMTQATMLTFDHNIEFSGATAPAGTSPWITATFDDSFGGANTVRLTMSATNLVGTEFIDDWLFNFDTSLNLASLNFAYISGQAANNVNTGVDAFPADGDGKFDIEFDFPPPPGAFASEFTTGETSVYDFTYISAITVSSFDFGSVPGGGNGTFKSAAHIQGIGTSGNDSGWIAPRNGNGEPIPEPTTMALLGIGLVGLAGAAARRKLKKEKQQ